MTDPLDTLRDSVARLAGIAGSLTADQLTAGAYPSEWTIADVLSHLGSGAVIFRRQLTDALAGTPTPGDFMTDTWDAWNAKPPSRQAADALAADQDLVTMLAALSDDDRGRVAVELGPFSLDYAGFVGLRSNEHVIHTWDVEVALDPTATLPAAAAGALADSLPFIARFAGRPTGSPREILVHTTDPDRAFLVRRSAESVSVEPTGVHGAPDLVLPTEALVRLVYGRLDPAHTPAVEGTVDLLDDLRPTFPGF
jgi:uncharacterized protein (TIGR03083 family)